MKLQIKKLWSYFMDVSFFSWVCFKPKTPGEQNVIPYLSPGNEISPDAMSQVERLPFITRTGKLSTWFTISPSTKSQIPPLANEKAGLPGLPESLGSGEVASLAYPASAPTTQQRARNLSLGAGETLGQVQLVPARGSCPGLVPLLHPSILSRHSIKSGHKIWKWG